MIIMYLISFRLFMAFLVLCHFHNEIYLFLCQTFYFWFHANYVSEQTFGRIDQIDDHIGQQKKTKITLK